MPNWSYVDYKIVGDKKKVKDFRDKIKRLEKRKTSPIKNDFGNLWWGNIVNALGGNWEDVPCRGYIICWDYDRKTGVLTLCSEMAWSERPELRYFIEEYYDNEVTIYFKQEESGLSIYETNDSEGIFFPERYKIDGYVDPWPSYYKDLESAAKDLSRFIEIDEIEPTLEDINDAIDKWVSIDPEENYLGLYIFEVV